MNEIKQEIETRKISVIKKNEAELDLAYLKSEYSNVLQNIKDICNATVGGASELYPHLDSLRSPASKIVVQNTMIFLQFLCSQYFKDIDDAKKISNQINNLENL